MSPNGCIHRAEGVIKEVHIGFFVKRASQADPCFLASAKNDASLPY